MPEGGVEARRLYGDLVRAGDGRGVVLQLHPDIAGCWDEDSGEGNWTEAELTEAEARELYQDLGEMLDRDA